MFARRGTRRGKLELALRRLERPRVDRRHLERDAGSHDARSRQPRDRRSRALAEREDVETVGSADQGVRLFADAVDDAVARADLEGLAVLPRETGPVEHEEDLLLRDLDVHRRRLLARTHPRSGHADVARSGRLAEVVALELDRALVLVARLEVVPVNDHVFGLSKREITPASSHGTSPL